MPGDGAIVGLRGPVADHDHRGGVAVAALQGPAPRAPAGPPSTQRSSELTAQLAAALDVQSLVDRLRRHPHLHLVREQRRQRATDLLRAPPLPKTILHPLVQLRLHRQLPRLRPGPPHPGALLGPVRVVGAGHDLVPIARRNGPIRPGWSAPARDQPLDVTVAGHFPAHRRRSPTEISGDRPDRAPSMDAVSDRDPLVLSQVPTRRRLGQQRI